jgi:Glycosyltransferase like family
MISIIICSKNSSLAEMLSKNIVLTIGVPFEIIAIDNSIHNNSICSIYNKGGSRAKYPLLCFVHEDVLFRTMNWGINLIHHFKNDSIGVLGIAGGDAISKVPCTWSNSFISKEVNIIQHQNKNLKKTTHLQLTNSNKKEIKKEVIAIDGVFIAVTKSVFNNTKFDEFLLHGFHGYDIDYSLQTKSKGYKNYVAFDILLEHFSQGNLNKAWLKSTFLVAKKWKYSLPISIHPLTHKQYAKYHWQSLHVLINHLFNFNFSSSKIYFYCLEYSCTKYFSARSFLSMNKLFFQLLSIKKDANKQKNTIEINQPHLTNSL